MPNEYIIEISKWVFILIDFMSFFFNNNIFEYGFSPGFKKFH
jgi:hypothetical protein